jgi:hypothetical protein
MKSFGKERKLMPLLGNQPKWYAIIIHAMEGSLGQGRWFANTS